MLSGPNPSSYPKGEQIVSKSSRAIEHVKENNSSREYAAASHRFFLEMTDINMQIGMVLARKRRISKKLGQ